MEESSRKKAALCDGKLVDTLLSMKDGSEDMRGQMCSDAYGAHSKGRRDLSRTKRACNGGCKE